LFICFEIQDKTIAEKLQTQFTDHGRKCVLGKNDVKANSRLILQSQTFIALISEQSGRSNKLRNQLALAENHNKTLFPIMVTKDIKLDAAMQYTLAKAPKFFIEDENYIKQIIYIIELSDRITTLNKESKDVSIKLAKLEEQVKTS